MATAAKTKLTIIVGAVGVGKSTAINKLLNMPKKIPRKLIVTRQMDEWDEYPENKLLKPGDYKFKGIQKHVPIDVRESLEKINELRNCIVVFDDARKYLPAQTDKEINNLYLSRRHYILDIYFVAHHFEQVPLQAFGFASDFILFKTVKPIDKSRLSQLNDPDKFLEAKRRIDKEAIKNPYYFERIKL